MKSFGMEFRHRTRLGGPFVPNMFSYFTHGFPNAIALPEQVRLFPEETFQRALTTIRRGGDAWTGGICPDRAANANASLAWSCPAPDAGGGGCRGGTSRRWCASHAGCLGLRTQRPKTLKSAPAPRVLSDNHFGRLRQPSWPVGLNGRRACPSGGQSHRPDSFSG